MLPYIAAPWILWGKSLRNIKNQTRPQNKATKATTVVGMTRKSVRDGQNGRIPDATHKMVTWPVEKKTNPVETWTRSPWCFVLFVPHAFKYQAAIVMWGWNIDMSDPFHFSDQALRHSHKRNRYPKSTGSSSYGEIAKNLDTSWVNFPIFRHRIIMFLKNPRNYPRFHDYIMTSMPYKKKN